ncbi:hypothetical protein [Pedobacter duraquae]|uniref:Uncharacterized protein n=1 Tax=Pedobacter duraquae TaxID=425511 RepID=A0A4R6ILN4_9SPHI|nr:hypothetical protein [Pedobacter duraquae]TDO23022.1 hypothetical protein CLV32_2008 [Pedobacter duraquae]
MKNQGIVGSVIMGVGGLCPLVHLPIIGNWNYFDIDMRLAIAFYVLVVFGLICSFLGKTSLIRSIGWAALVLIGITLAGVYFKSHDYFSFIHFKKLVNFAAGIVKYKWGWFVILVGSLLLVTVRKNKVVIITETMV